MGLVENVKTACAESEITVTELEQASGLPDNAIYKWNTHNPGIDKVKRVADVLGVTVDRLISEERRLE